MPRSIGEFDSNPKLRDLKARIPTIDELMRRPQPPPWWEFLPPPAQPNDNPFGPVPIIPPLSPPPIEVDPPSRPPEWFFGPPYISSAPTQPFSFVPSHAPFVAPEKVPAAGSLAERIAALKGGFSIPTQNAAPSSVFGTSAPPLPLVAAPLQEKPGGILGMMAEAGLIDPSGADRPPPGGLLGLMQECLRNNKNGVVGG